MSTIWRCRSEGSRRYQDAGAPEASRADCGEPPSAGEHEFESPAGASERSPRADEEGDFERGYAALAKALRALEAEVRELKKRIARPSSVSLMVEGAQVVLLDGRAGGDRRLAAGQVVTGAVIAAPPLPLIAPAALVSDVTNGLVEPKALYSVEEVAWMLGCKRTRVYQLLREGRLERAPERFGRRTSILATSVKKLLDVPPPEAAPPRPRRAPGAPKRQELAATSLAAQIAKLPVE